MKETISILGCGWLGLPLGAKLVEAGYSIKGSSTREEKRAVIHEAGMQPCLLTLTPEPEGELEPLLNSDILFINVPPVKAMASLTFISAR